jgi:acyl carrier protein
MYKKIIAILTAMKPEHEFAKDTELFESGLLDSFDLLVLVSEIEAELAISIPGEGLIPENFVSPFAIGEYLKSIEG